MNYLEKKKKAMLNYVSGGRLPSEYQEVDYLYRVTGNVYVNTNYYFTTNTDMRLDYLMPSTLGNIAFASSSIGYQQKNASQCEVVSTSRTLIDAPYNNKYNVKFGANGIWLDGIQVHQTSVARTTSDQMQLFAYQSGWSSNVHIYRCQFYESGNLVMDLIPCYRKSDNKLGMYDIVGQTFKEKGGSGVMTYGNEV